MAAGPTVGLDIGSHAIKVAELVSGRTGVSVRALGVAPTPSGAIENSVVVDAKVLGEAVKKLLKQSGISTKNCVSSVSGQGALVVRVIEVPKMTDAELADQMKWEVERHVPFAANDVIMDFQRIERPDAPEDAQNMEVLLAVAQQDMIDRHVDTLLAAGLRPAAVDVEPLAASRALVELGDNPYADGRTVVIVNIGASNTDLGIIHNGILAFPRTLPLAGDTMTKAIAEMLNVPEEEAESLKREKAEVLSSPNQQTAPIAAEEGFMDFSVQEAGPAAEAATAGGEDVDTAPIPEPSSALTPTTGGEITSPIEAGPSDPVQSQLYSAIAPTLTDLVGEVRRSLEYYRGRMPDDEVDEIVLCGGSAKLKNLTKLFTDELGIPTRVADAFHYAHVSARNVAPDYVESVSPEFAVAVGLAARDMIAVPAPPSAKGKRGKK